MPEGWLVNLDGDSVEVYRNPEGSADQETAVYDATEAISPEARPDLGLSVEELL